MSITQPSRRGFAAMSPEQRRLIASKGGRSVPADRRSFSQDPELAARAGRKGGQASTRHPAETNTGLSEAVSQTGVPATDPRELTL